MPSISTPRLLELERAEKRLKELEAIQSIKWIGHQLGEALATILATKKWEDWTQQEKAVLRDVCRNADIAMEIYKSLLPK